MTDFKEAIGRAVAWLRENPTRHIRGDLAVDAKGETCPPNAPQAECFCVLGRISKELDYDGYPDDADPSFEIFLNNHGSATHKLFGLNDMVEPNGLRRAHCPGTNLANPDVLNLIQEKLL